LRATGWINVMAGFCGEGGCNPGGYFLDYWFE
jgi:hypothetical protein